MADPKIDKLKQTAENIQGAGEAVGGVFKNLFVGSKDKASGAVGGIAGFVKGIGETAFNIANGTVNIAAKTVQKFPKLTAAAAVIGAAVGVKKWMDNREKSKELDNARDTNALLETKLANDALEAQLQSGKPVFDNPNARTDHVAKLAAAQAQQAAAAR